MHIKTLLNLSAERLVKISDSPYLDVELLLTYVLNVTRAYLHSHPEQELSWEQQNLFHEIMRRRLVGEPVAYILKQQAFWTINLTISKDVLIPRPETELLVEIILEKFSSTVKYEIADLGTGSGAIALALAQECPKWQLAAIDNSAAALAIAQQNAQQLRLKNVEFFQGDWCAALPSKKYHVLVSNPPYIAEDDPNLIALQYEPRQALLSGKTGLDDLSAIIKQAQQHLYDDGILLLEHGYNQGVAVRKLLQENHYQDICTYRDLADCERVTVGKFVASTLNSQ